MKILGSFIVCLVLCQSISWADQNNGGVDRPFVVIELFGSEGCSSCPPADEILRSWTAAAKTQGKNIFTLSFHVDYWNYLGWVDPFSSPRFTKRQHAYAKALKRSSVYTPQMIINGTNAFVGSDKRLVEQYVAQYLRMPPENQITITLGDETDPKHIKVLYSYREWTVDAVVNIALVEGGLESQVTNGENDGQLLKHENVVREFTTVPLVQKEGMVLMPKPTGDDLSRFSVIVYLQRTSDMKILAAGSIGLLK